MKEEMWETIKGYEEYEVSSRGRVFRFDITSRNRWGSFLLPSHMLCPYLTKNGYRRVPLIKDKKSKKFLLHRLVAKSFIPNPENKPQINHKDGDKENNNVENLEWCTHSENMRHAIATGLKVAPKGEEHTNSKLTEGDILEIRRLDGAFPYTEIAERYHVSLGLISHIIHRRAWKCVV